MIIMNINIIPSVDHGPEEKLTQCFNLHLSMALSNTKSTFLILPLANF